MEELLRVPSRLRQPYLKPPHRWQLNVCAQYFATSLPSATPPSSQGTNVPLFEEVPPPPPPSDSQIWLLNLPFDVLFRLLKHYVPAEDKIRTLSRLPAFGPFLREPSLFFPSVRELKDLEELLPSGWYRFPDRRGQMLHAAAHYPTLTWHLDLYQLPRVPWRTYHEVRDFPVSYPEVRRRVRRLARRRPAPNPVGDFLYYRFSHPISESVVTVWIFPETGQVWWSETGQTFWLDERETCQLLDETTHTGLVWIEPSGFLYTEFNKTLTIHLQPDRSLWIRGTTTERVPSREIRTFPVRYGICDEKQKNPARCCRCDLSIPCLSQVTLQWKPENGRIDLELQENNHGLRTAVPEWFR